MRFAMEIQMNNSDIQTGQQLADLFPAIATALAPMGQVGDEGGIQDMNGNTVGRWVFQDM